LSASSINGYSNATGEQASTFTLLPSAMQVKRIGTLFTVEVA